MLMAFIEFFSIQLQQKYSSPVILVFNFHVYITELCEDTKHPEILKLWYIEKEPTEENDQPRNAIVYLYFGHCGNSR